MMRRAKRARTEDVIDIGEGDDDASGAFREIVSQLAPSVRFDASLRDALASVDSLVKQVFGPGSRALPFGSVIQGLHLQGSDLDVCLDLPGHKPREDQKTDNKRPVALLQRILGRIPRTFRLIEARLWNKIKVPIIILGYSTKMGDHLEIDISVDAKFDGVGKSFTDRLIRSVIIDYPRVLHTARVIKLWAKVEKLNKAFEGYLNSLGWTLLVLFFFIERGEIASEQIRAHSISNEDEDDRIPPLPQSTDRLLEDVPSCNDVADFFEWLVDYSSSWPQSTSGSAWAISLHDGSLIDVPIKEKQYPDQSFIFIEDPGIRLVKGVAENVARSLKQGTWAMTMRKCEYAATQLRSENGRSAEVWATRLLREVSPLAASAIAGRQQPFAHRQALSRSAPDRERAQVGNGHQVGSAIGAVPSRSGALQATPKYAAKKAPHWGNYSTTTQTQQVPPGGNNSATKLTQQRPAFTPTSKYGAKRLPPWSDHVATRFSQEQPAPKRFKGEARM